MGKMEIMVSKGGVSLMGLMGLSGLSGLLGLLGQS
jgi:hypothetical protein